MAFKVADVLGVSLVVDYREMWKEAGVEAELVQNPCSFESTDDDVMKAVGDADAVIAQAAYQPFTRKVLSSLPNCKFIISVGIGYERLDIDAATDLGIMAANVPDIYVEEVSDHAMALILACTRRLVELDRIVKTVGWKAQPDPYIGSEVWPKMWRLRDKTLGLIGFGRIPRALVPKAKGFGVRILVYDPYVEPQVFRDFGVEQVDLDTLLRESDAISIHAPHTKQTQHLIGLEELKKMKPTACLVNTARGPLIDHNALYVALKDGIIAAAAVDVTEPEPIPAGSQILKLDNFVVTAHSAHAYGSANPALSQRPGEEIIRVIRGEWPIGLINHDVKERYRQKWSQS
jgi:D-3-phosphoglycerate dehydrogenase